MSGNFTEKQRVLYVARAKDTGLFACDGPDTGMGRIISSTTDLAAAKFCSSPTGVMTWMGGHYRNYDAVKVTITYELGEAEAFPSEPEVWPDSWRGSR